MPTVPPLIVPTQSDAQTSLRAFLLDVMPVGTAVVLGQPNRVPEPAGAAFVVMTPILIKRLGTNRGTGFDVKFTGSVTGTRSTNHTPSAKSPARSAATAIASRVLPTPPGPTAVT